MGDYALTQERVKELFEYSNGKLFRNGKRVGSPPTSSIKYRRVGFDCQVFLEHRIIFLWHHGWLPKIVDHIDGDRLNNRIENLREASKQENEINSKVAKGEIPFRGVARAMSGRYRAYINDNYKQIHIGVFDTPREASEAYENKRQELYPGIYKKELRDAKAH